MCESFPCRHFTDKICINHKECVISQICLPTITVDEALYQLLIKSPEVIRTICVSGLGAFDSDTECEWICTCNLKFISYDMQIDKLILKDETGNLFEYQYNHALSYTTFTS